MAPSTDPDASLPDNQSRLQARLALAALGVVLTVGVTVSLWAPPPTSQEASKAPGADLILYARIVERVRGGEDYYAVAFDELPRGEYPIQSVFNWRLPTYAWLLALFPTQGGQLLLCALAVLALGLAFTGECRYGSMGQAGVVVAILIGVVIWSVDGAAYLAQEVWVGVLLTLALASYHLERPWLGFAAAGAALFLRELVLPFTAVAAWLAWRASRPREVLAWIAAWCLFVAYWAWHAHNVRALVPAPSQPAESWLAFGGPGFVLRCVQMNQWLFNLPLWIAAVYFTLGLAGLLSWTTYAGRLCGFTVLVYAGAFLFVGKSFNTYWGLVFAPALPFGVVRGPSAVYRFLVRAGCLKE